MRPPDGAVGHPRRWHVVRGTPCSRGNDTRSRFLTPEGGAEREARLNQLRAGAGHGESPSRAAGMSCVALVALTLLVAAAGPSYPLATSAIALALLPGAVAPYRALHGARRWLHAVRPPDVPQARESDLDVL